MVQVTPPGSATSVIFGTGVSSATPGSTQGLYLVVSDIEAARLESVDHGVAVGNVFHDATGIFNHAEVSARVPGPDPQRGSYASFASFSHRKHGYNNTSATDFDYRELTWPERKNTMCCIS